MNDQAQSLRNIITSREQSSSPDTGDRVAKIITVSSGKGGVGKSNFTLNFALALQSLGKKVLLFDADIGMANIDVLMGVRAPYSLYHLLKGEKSIREIVDYGTNGLPFIAGGSGMIDLFTLSESDLSYFTQQIEEISGEMDYVIFDTGAGLSKETLKFITAADECLVVTTPEPTSITDAYALIKVVSNLDLQEPVTFKLMINRVEHEREAKQVAEKISLVARKFLNLEIPMIGSMSDDPHVVQAVKKQVPFSIAYPSSAASRDVHRVASEYIAASSVQDNTTFAGIKGFLHRWLKRTK
ncbi:flagellar biosynthesis protein FlhG [Paenibacillus shirakamiensis]|uniref:Flagellar biosynthesis protein FlhG n=1 Tax=Paenibacillus shirakamiensis TaxID=1265935 RepID=A0ABS4JJ08_9BACL|nr:MinD/ParA family protein [Paenibacillus shirakamiensis]MBP2001100.1 flagellar biosynthesis protein FlhG [Paenibacillus shirakamiensis]